jgi:hypothetical protein
MQSLLDKVTYPSMSCNARPMARMSNLTPPL